MEYWTKDIENGAAKQEEKTKRKIHRVRWSKMIPCERAKRALGLFRPQAASHCVWRIALILNIHYITKSLNSGVPIIPTGV